MLNRSSLVAAVVLAVGALPGVAQKVYTKQDYTQAERWMSYNVAGLVHHTIRGVTYLPSGRVFYRDPGVGGTAYMIAAPAAVERRGRWLRRLIMRSWRRR